MLFQKNCNTTITIFDKSIQCVKKRVQTVAIFCVESFEEKTKHGMVGSA